ncbi:MAG: capsule assembly Wzi family protein, partial [bacterium]
AVLFEILSPRQNWHFDQHTSLLDRVIGAIRHENALGGNSMRLDYRLVPYSQELIADDAKPTHRIGTNAEAWFGYHHRWQVHIRARLENHGELDPQFHGRVWKDKLTGWVDNAAVYYSVNRFFVSAGRSFIHWGPESPDALLLSDHSPPLDRLWLGYENNTFRFDAIYSRLDDMHVDGDTLNRYLSAHRLTFRKAGLFELGLSEVALYGGPGRQLEWYYLNPFLPYYWEQWNQRTEDNIMMGADFVVYWPKRARLFGELLIDDFQVDFESEPHQVGYKLGIDALEPFGLSRLFTKLTYTRINPTVYGQILAQNLYLHEGEPLGYFGGNDQDRWLGLLRYHANVNLDLELELQRQRRGEGRIEMFPVAAVPFEDKFPTGIVEKSTLLTLRCDFFTKLLLQGRISASYEHLDTFAHQDGVSDARLALDIYLAWYLSGSTNN